MIKFAFYMILFCLNEGNAWSSTHHPQFFLQEIKGAENEGEQIVKHYCSSCHASNPLILLGAPRINHVDDWQQRTKQGMKSLFAHTDEGLNAMPARGGCFECSDEQLWLAIMELLPETLKKDIKINLKPIK